MQQETQPVQKDEEGQVHRQEMPEEEEMVMQRQSEEEEEDLIKSTLD